MLDQEQERIAQDMVTMEGQGDCLSGTSEHIAPFANGEMTFLLGGAIKDTTKHWLLERQE